MRRAGALALVYVVVGAFIAGANGYLLGISLRL
jgi:hypothetical protein